MLNSSRAKISVIRELILIIFLGALVLVILVMVVKDFVIPEVFKKKVVEEELKPPAFLSSPLPSIEKIKAAIDNPKLDELKFYRLISAPVEGEGPAEELPSKPETLEDLAKKVKVEKIGRPNPFIPFEE
ncbi:MAG: hypothetical protein ACP5IX_00890 [Patescibacteria group bacterium]